MIPTCHYCHAHHCLQSCPGPLPSQRPGAEYDSTPLPMPEAGRTAQRDACLTALRELEQECRSSAPSPVTLRELAGCVARSCPQEFTTLAGPVVRLSSGYAGLIELLEVLAEPRWEPGMPIRSEVSTTLRLVRESLSAACVALRVQLEPVPESLTAEVR